MCLEHIKKNLDLDRIEVIVVDNGSNDNSLAYLRSIHWIKLIERSPSISEHPVAAHGNGLDAALAEVSTPLMLVIHSDTLIHSADLITTLESEICSANVVAVGCVDQVHRPIYRKVARKIKQLYRPKRAKNRGVYLKSHCCLYNADLVKSLNLNFLGSWGNPGEEMQAILKDKGYGIKAVSSAKMFKYMDHVQSGTVVEQGLTKNKRRISSYRHLISE